MTIASPFSPTPPTNHTTPPEDPVDQLLDMDDEDFYELVKQDRRLQATPDAELPPLIAALRHDDALDRWREAIDRQHADLIHSITEAANRRSTAIAAGDWPEAAKWRSIRAKAIRALEGAKEQRREVKELAVARHHRRGSHDAYGRALRRLRDAHPDEFARYVEEEEAAEREGSTP